MYYLRQSKPRQKDFAPDPHLSISSTNKKASFTPFWVVVHEAARDPSSAPRNTYHGVLRPVEALLDTCFVRNISWSGYRSISEIGQRYTREVSKQDGVRQQWKLVVIRFAGIGPVVPLGDQVLWRQTSLIQFDYGVQKLCKRHSTSWPQFGRKPFHIQQVRE